MKKTFLILIFFLYHLNGFAQENEIIVTGTVTDADSGMPIPGGDFNQTDRYFPIPQRQIDLSTTAEGPVLQQNE